MPSPPSAPMPPVPLRPGDVLLYYSSGPFNWAIALKTWHRVSHVETYIGDGKSIASRNGLGVATYPLRLDGLIRVLRPKWNWDLQNVLRWQRTVEGQSYDWKSLFAFIGLREKPDEGMFCSEHAALAALASGGCPFSDEPCGAIAPFQFDVTPVYETVWSK